MKKIFLFLINFVLFIALLNCENVYNDIRDDIGVPIIAITLFSFSTPSAMGIIDQKNHIITVPVPFGTNLTALVPTITHTGVSINPTSGVAQNFTSPVTYSVTAIDGSTQDYTVTVMANIAKAITTFNFTSPVATGIINEANHTISVTVPYGTNVTTLVPVITHTGLSINPVSGVVQNFTSPVIYTVTAAADGSIQDYMVTVTVSQLAIIKTTDIASDLTFTIDIAGTSAKGGGNVTNQGASTVTERGLCWNTAGSPSMSDSHAADGSGTGVFNNVSMTGLTTNTTYYVKAYAINNQGTAFSNEITFNSGRTFGTDYANGYVFYNNGIGGGLVSAKTDQSTSQAWIVGGFTQTTSNGNTSMEIGTGLANSNAIIAQTGHTGSAAKVCLDYSDSTYSDWYLPSRDELNLMYTNLKVIGVGNFVNDSYWSSSEAVADGAWIHDFNLGSQGYTSKSVLSHVRAVRTF